MMVRKIMLFLMMSIFAVAGMGRADGWEANLNAGGTSVLGGVHYKRDLANGYMKVGGSGLYTDDDNMKYKWAEFNFAVGRENISTGLTCDVGFKGIVGDAEENRFSGDVGVLAFTGYIGYLFPQEIMPIPLEPFCRLSYAPEVLSFRDTEDFFSWAIGIGIRIIQNASVILEYSAVDVDMESGPGSWTLDDDVIRLGLVLRY